MEPVVEVVFFPLLFFFLSPKKDLFFLIEAAANFVQILLLAEIVVFIFSCPGTQSVSSGSLVCIWDIESSFNVIKVHFKIIFR